MKRLVRVAALILLVGCESNDRPSGAESATHSVRIVGAVPPQFEHFPADTFVGKVAAPDLATAPSVQRFRTVLGGAVAAGPNFAGHLTIVTWGCGTQCRSHAFVDARSGHIYLDSILDFSCRQPEFRRNSTLIVERPDTVTFGSCAGTRTRYLRWTGAELVDITAPAI